jgi:hypothetical protein
MIAAVDEFILFDDIQYTRRQWRNRNLIKTPKGLIWLTVPVQVKGKYHQKIRDTRIDGYDWSAAHWRSLTLNYCRAPCFEEVAAFLKPIYLRNRYDFLSELNRSIILAVCSYLGITTRITNSCDYTLVNGKTERLVDLCRQAGARAYVSGPAAKNYIEEMQFSEAGIELKWFDYHGYSVYPQLSGEFVHGVSILDLLFNCGLRSAEYMRYVPQGCSPADATY